MNFEDELFYGGNDESNYNQPNFLFEDNNFEH